MADQVKPDEQPDFESDDAYTLDANAVAGMLAEIFGSEMTSVASRCAHCGNRAMMGSLREKLRLGHELTGDELEGVLA